jgi:predicted transcriptional regulator of viral defense system
MQIKNYLTKKEQLIYNYLKNINIVIENKDLKDCFNDLDFKDISYILNSLYKKGYLYKINRSRFAVIKDRNIKDLFKLATSIYSGYISLSSALYYYGLLDYNIYTIYIINTKKSKEINLGEYTLKYINITKKNNYVKNKDGFYISTIEKTIFDCFYKIEYAGGYSLLSKAIYEGYTKIDWTKFLEIYNKYASKRQHQITGYILELLITNCNIKIPKKVITYFKNKNKSKTKLLNIKNKSKYIKKWEIEDNLGKDKILSWWY